MRIINKKYIITVIIILVLLEISSLFLLWKSLSNKTISIENLNVFEKIDDKHSFAIMLGDKDGNYEKTESNIWPSNTRYIYNEEKSICKDNSGNILSNVLTYNSSTGIASVKVLKSTHCYLYFDKKIGLDDLCESGTNLGNCLINNTNKIDSLTDTPTTDDLYNYVGTNDVVENYICFGTADKDTCINNTGQHMYRILGIKQNGQVKLIKKEALDEGIAWFQNHLQDIPYGSSGPHIGINGTKFLTNKTYMPDGWIGKISTESWPLVRTHGYYGGEFQSVNEASAGTVTSKISLITKNNFGTYSSWLKLSENDPSPVTSGEWTSSTHDALGYYYAYQTSGIYTSRSGDDSSSTRPVFFLNQDEVYISGSGRIDDPIIIKDPNENVAVLCNEGEKIGSCLISKKDSIGSLSDDLVGEMYRYQGENPDNYICFGTTDKNLCTSNTDAYMYRIMGINENNQLKLIKKEALNTGEKWYNLTSTDVTWPKNTIYNSINGDAFLGNKTYMPNGWKNKIADIEWKYGETRPSSNNMTADGFYNIENAFTTTHLAKIGLMYAYEYAYGIKNGNDCINEVGYYSCKASWLHISNNDTGAPATKEWTMSKYGKESNSIRSAWYIDANGKLVHTSMTNTNSARPVFYLNQDEVYISGSGKIDDPIILSEPEVTTIGDEIKKQSPTGLNTNKEGGMYRFQGTTADNHICFGTSTKSNCTANTDAYMYRIIGITDDGKLKVIKKEALGSGMYWATQSQYDNEENIQWKDSIIYSELNGASFLNNTTYVPSGWSDRIAAIDWKYGDIQYDDTGKYPQSAIDMYNMENSWTTKVTNKIGLMYIHDYYYGLVGGNNCGISANAATCKTSWIHLYNNDSNYAVGAEWTMSNFNDDGPPFWVGYIYPTGSISSNGYRAGFDIRPVFYINSDVEFGGGTGTSDDPFMMN